MRMINKLMSLLRSKYKVRTGAFNPVYYVQVRNLMYNMLPRPERKVTILANGEEFLQIVTVETELWELW